MLNCLRTRRKKEEGSGDELQHGQQSSIPLIVRVDRPPGEIGEEKPGTSSVTEKEVQQAEKEEMESEIPLITVRVDRPPGEKEEETPGTSSMTEVRVEQSPGEGEETPGTSSMTEEGVEQPPGEEEDLPGASSMSENQMHKGASESPDEQDGEVERMNNLAEIYEDCKRHTCKELQHEFRSSLILDAGWCIMCLGPEYENVTAPDDLGNTPLHYAVMGNCLQFVTSYGDEHPETLDKQNKRGETPLHIAAWLNHFKTFKELVHRNVELRTLSRDDRKSCLHYAAINGNTKMAHLLLQKPEDRLLCACRDAYGRIPLSYAAEEGHVELANILLTHTTEYGTDENQMFPHHYAAKNGHTDVIRVLLQHKGVLKHLKSTNSNGNNCLDLAIEGNHRETVLALISGASNWDEMFRIQNESNPSPFRKLISKMPDAAREVLNRCITINGNGDDLKVIFNYEFLEDNPPPKDRDNLEDSAREVHNRCITLTGNGDDLDVTSNYEFLEDNRPLEGRDNGEDACSYEHPEADKLKEHPLKIMVTEKRWELLEHPVVSALVKKKWIHGIRFYFFNIILYIIFLICLMVFAMTIEAPFLSLTTSAMANISSEDNATRYKILEFEEQMKSTSAMTNISSEVNATHYKIPEFEEQMKRNLTTDISSSDNSTSLITKMVKWAIIILAVLNISVQSVKRWHFFKKGQYFKGHVLEWIACITALCFAIGPDSGYRALWQWSFGMISIFLSWTIFFSQFQKLEFLSMHIILLKRIFKEFLKFFMVVCFPLVVVFVFCFYILFQNQKEFGSWVILVKTTAMMIGEVEFNEMFFGEDVHNYFISFFAFFVFLVFMTLLVANIMIGIAVDKIREFRREAPSIKKEMQINFVFTLERHAKQLAAIIPRCLRHRNEEPEEIYFPNKKKIIGKRFARAWNLTEEDIMTAKNSGIVMKPTNKELLIPLKTELIALEDDINDDMRSLESNLMTKVKTFTEDIHKEFKQDVQKYIQMEILPSLKSEVLTVKEDMHEALKSVTSSLNEEAEKISKQNEVNTMELKSSIDSVQNTMKEEVQKYIQMEILPSLKSEVLTVKEDMHEALKSVTSSLKEVAEKIGEQRK